MPFSCQCINVLAPEVIKSPITLNGKTLPCIVLIYTVVIFRGRAARANEKNI